jgi:thiol-disulfide isomerase/thioredoxin
VKYLFIIFLFAFTSVHAQGIVIDFDDFEKAKVASAQKDQLIFVNIYAEWCGPCRAMETSIFSQTEVANLFNSQFINLKIDSDTPNGKVLAKLYAIKEYPTYLFVNHTGEIIHKIIGFHSSGKLIEEGNSAIRKEERFVSIKTLDSTYHKGEQNPEFLYSYLKRKSFEEGPQASLLDTYLDVVPKSELKTEKVLALISDNVTSVSSRGFYILSESLSRFMQMTETQQKAILHGISNSKRITFREAVEKKDDELFDVLIDAVHATSYSMEAAFAEERQFRYDYAKLTKNYKHFKIIAQEEASQIMMKTLEDFTNQTAETVKGFEKAAVEKGISSSSSRYKMMLNGLKDGASKSASFQLNEFAWGYFEMASEEQDLKNAIKWSAYSIKLAETPANWETYAFLLKKIGRKKDANKALKQALKLGKKSGVETETIKKAYQKIK